MSAEEFIVKFYSLADVLLEKLPTEDSAGVQAWIEEDEAARLVHTFHRFVIRLHAESRPQALTVFFNRDCFLAYVGRYIHKYAAAEYWRWKSRNRSMSAKPLSPYI